MQESFVVSARKYRPSTFKTVIGQDHITIPLKKAVSSGHLAQAYLFTGPRGIGKTTCARILAKAVNCLNLSEDGEPCNECSSCKTFNEQRSFNIFELDGASNNSVDDIRELINQIRIPPQAGKYKTYIIDEVHMLSPSAFNAFLKTLEEPPAYAIFILATTEKHKIIPTVLSRCQINDFKRLEIKDIVRQLQIIAENEGIKADDSALHIIAQKADGAMRDALTIFDRLVSVSDGELSYDIVIKSLNIIDYEYFFKAAELIAHKNIQDIFLLLDELIKLGFDCLNFLTGLSEHYRNLFVISLGGAAELLEIPDLMKEKFKNQIQIVSKSFAVNALNVLNQFVLSFKDSKNQRLHTEICLMKLCYLNDAVHLATGLQEQKKKLIKPDEDTFVEKKQENAVTEKAEEQDVAANSLKNLNSLEKISQHIRSNSGKHSQENNEGKESAEEEFIPVSREKFEIAWQDYLENQISKSHHNLYIILKKKPPEVMADGSVRFIFPNSALLDMFQKERIKFADFLFEKYQIRGVRLHIEIESQGAENKGEYLTSPREIFEFMAKKNPEIINLANALRLIPE